MKIYVSRRDENITARLDEAYSTEQTVILDYLTGPKAGTNTCITYSTLKRWWKETEIDEVIEDETDTNLELLAGGDSKEQSETVIKEHELVAMSGIEKLEELKNEYSSSSKLSIEDIATALSDFTVKPFPSTPNYLKISIKNGKGIGEVDVCRKGLTVYVNKKYKPEPNPIECKEMSSSYQYKIPYTEYTSDILVSLF